MSYTVDYAGDGPAQAGALAVPAASPAPVPYRAPRRFVVPGILKTGTTFLVAAAMFFGAESFAPDAFRPSTLMGTYESRVNAEVQSAVKAAELEQQARYEVWAAEVKVSAEQQVEHYKALNQGILARYQAAYDRGRVWAEATARIQGQYVAARVGQVQATQGTDVAVINWARLFGRAANLIDPGAGDAALVYADNLTGQLSGELTDAVTRGQTISVEGWDTGLATVDDLKRELDSVPRITIPAPPRLRETK